MLAYALFFVTLVALCVGALLDGGLAFARASVRHAAQHYAEAGFLQARAALVAGIAAQVQAGTQPLTAPADLSAPAGPFQTSAKFTLAGGTAAGTGGAGGNVVATDLQTHQAIAEQRVAAAIAITIAAPDGTPLAARTQYVTLRTFAVPPYAIIEGTSDAAGARDVPTEADAAGCDPARPAACDANNSGSGTTPGDTRIRALSRCVDGGSGACAGVTYIAADPANTPAATTWQDANAQSTGWSR